MIDTTILIDQSYFLQDNENIKTPEEKAKDFIGELLKAKKDSNLLINLETEIQDNIFSEFLFLSLNLFSKDPSNIPTGRKLDEYILSQILQSSDEEVEEDKEGEGNGEEEGEGEGETQIGEGTGLGEGKIENSESSQGPEESMEFGEDFENNENNGGGEGYSNRRDEEGENDSVEIIDGYSTTIRRNRTDPRNRFF